jgi:periplasmic divalent cation tolerance protein
MDEASAAARGAIDARLAACANIVGNIRSVYRWQGRIEDEGEILAIFKTSEARADELGEFLRANHPYDTPAILRHSGILANADYERWIEQETGITS